MKPAPVIQNGTASRSYSSLSVFSDVTNMKYSGNRAKNRYGSNGRYFEMNTPSHMSRLLANAVLRRPKARIRYSDPRMATMFGTCTAGPAPRQAKAPSISRITTYNVSSTILPRRTESLRRHKP